jgi:LysM repeat protein
LKKAGYATDPNYPRKLIELIERYQLDKFDKGIDVTYQPKPAKSEPRDRSRPRKPVRDEVTVTIGDGPEVFEFEGRIKYVKAKEGQTISDIAARLEQMPGWLAGWNDMARDQKLEEGQVVFIQPKRNKSKTTEFHIAEEGETLWGISQRYGVKLKKVAQYNGIGIADPVRAGQKVWLRKPRD